MRLFLAVPLPAEVQKALSKFSGALKEIGGAKGTYPKATDMHITLQFLGDVDEEKKNGLVSNLYQSLSPYKNLPDISIEQIGAFPNMKSPRVIWVGGIASEPLLRLMDTIKDETKKIGVVPEYKTFIPHVTIMRIKHIEDSRKWVAGLMKLRWTPQIVPLQKVVLFQSQLTEHGPIYTELNSFGL
ncbi:MAG: RNA 2',3'-cyclic phosphodiesterase [bacterium]|nr:RNA 2',3'-cyclic phosphodiesterase [bacterium]